MQMPVISSYVKSSSDNYGVNALQVDFCGIMVWFSYKTVVAFRVPGFERVVHQNDWGVTTGKHLNAIDGGDKKSRVNDQEFQAKWNAQVEPLDPLLQAIVAAHR